MVLNSALQFHSLIGLLCSSERGFKDCLDSWTYYSQFMLIYCKFIYINILQTILFLSSIGTRSLGLQSGSHKMLSVQKVDLIL